VNVLLAIRREGLGSVISCTPGVLGGAAAENGFYAYLRSEIIHSETPVSRFLSDGGPPNVVGPLGGALLTSEHNVSLERIGKFSK